MARVYLSLSSNLGDRLACLKAAVARLRSSTGIRFVSASTLYETEPWESEPGQPAAAPLGLASREDRGGDQQHAEPGGGAQRRRGA